MSALGPGVPESASPPLARSITGAASELIVCAELMRLGFYVFRCESPTSPFDLVAYADGKCLRIEVKTLSFQANYAPVVSIPTNDEWDLVAYVGKQNDVFIFKPQESASDLRKVVHEVVRGHYGYAPARQPGFLPCGTEAGYSRHIREGEPVCRPCRTASRAARNRRAALSGGAA